MDKDFSEAAGCIMALIQTTVVVPVWLFILYKLIEATNQPPLVWGLYFAYVPLAFLTILMTRILEEATKE